MGGHLDANAQTQPRLQRGANDDISLGDEGDDSIESSSDSYRGNDRDIRTGDLDRAFPNDPVDHHITETLLYTIVVMAGWGGNLPSRTRS